MTPKLTVERIKEIKRILDAAPVKEPKLWLWSNAADRLILEELGLEPPSYEHLASGRTIPYAPEHRSSHE